MTFVRRIGILILGVVLVAVGVLLAIIDGGRPHVASFGWTAYAPLPNTTFVPEGLSQFGDVPEILIALGLVAVVIWLALGRGSGKNFALAASVGIPLLGVALIVLGFELGQPPREALVGVPSGYEGTALVASGGITGILFVDAHAAICLAMVIAGVAIAAGSIGFSIARAKVRKVESA